MSLIESASDDRPEHPVDVVERMAAVNEWAFDRAEDEAKKLKDEYVSTEHLLLALAEDKGGAGEALRGAGATRLVTAAAFTLQWGVQLPLAWLIGVHLGFGLPGMAISRLCLFAAEAVIVTLLWRNGFWSRVHIP